MIEHIVSGIIQGIAEWLPISSEGALFLIKVNFFHWQGEIGELVQESLFLHLGTFLAALIYLRREVVVILKTLFNYRVSNNENQRILKFLVISTFVSGVLGFIVLKIISDISDSYIPGKLITAIIGLLLLITAWLQIRAKGGDTKKADQLKTGDGLILGLSQGLAALPGLSRSGITIASLLLRGFDKSLALRLSFLMSLPIVLAGNIILNVSGFSLSYDSFIALAFSFLFGLLTIDILLRLAKKINFGYFVLSFAVLTFLAAIV